MADSIVFTEAPTGPDAPEDTNEENNQNNNDSKQEGDRPGWLPDNFKTPEDFRKSFDEQRSELTKLQQERADATKKGGDDEGEGKDDKPDDKKDGKGDDDKKDGDKKDGDKPNPSELTEDDVADFSQELAETGELSDESRAKVKEMFNAPDWAVDTYIAGVKAQNEAANSAIVNAFGGTEAQNEMLTWAGQSLPDAEMNTLNKQFQSGDMGTVLFAVDALKAKYEAANGRAPSARLDGSGNNSASTATYQSWDQVNKDMNDPKYHSDPAFRAQVKEKLRGFNG